MSSLSAWALVLPLALGVFALAAWAFRLERRLWTTLLATMAFGLVGYALQARPELAGAPHGAIRDPGADQWASVEARKEMVSARYRSGNDRLLIADAFTRRGRYADAAILLRGAIAQNPRDAEAWLALANALVEHAQGILTPAALYAYRESAEAAPGSAAPGYFLGLALLRDGRITEARDVWSGTLAAASQDTGPRDLLAERVSRLDLLLEQAASLREPAAAAPGQVR